VTSESDSEVAFMRVRFTSIILSFPGPAGPGPGPVSLRRDQDCDRDFRLRLPASRHDNDS
jgi:hypothetical protein